MRIYSTPDCTPIIFDKLEMKENSIELDNLDRLSYLSSFTNLKEFERNCSITLKRLKENPSYDGFFANHFPLMYKIHTKYKEIKFSIDLGIVFDGNYLNGIVCREKEKLVGYVVKNSHPFVRKIVKAAGVQNKNIVTLSSTKELEEKFSFPITMSYSNESIYPSLSLVFTERLKDEYLKRKSVDNLKRTFNYYLPYYESAYSYEVEEIMNDPNIIGVFNVFKYIGDSTTLEKKGLKKGISKGDYIVCNNNWGKYIGDWGEYIGVQVISRRAFYSLESFLDLEHLFLVKKPFPILPLTFADFIFFMSEILISSFKPHEYLRFVPEKVQNTFIHGLGLNPVT